MTFKQWDRQRQEEDSTCGCLVCIVAAIVLVLAAAIIHHFA